MKFIVLLGLVGFAVASSLSGHSQQPRWQSGQEYVFEYNGRILTGLPELAADYSGVAMKAKIHVSVLSDSQYALSAKNVQYVSVNQGTRTPSDLSRRNSASGAAVSDNWRNIELPQTTPIPSEWANYLQETTRFRFDRHSGAFESMTVSSEEPEWSINFKKALVALFQTKMADSQSAIESNKVESESATESYWKVTEESLDGDCEVMYQQNIVPDYMVKDLHGLLSEESLRVCHPNGRYVEIIKTKDVSSCKKYAAFNYYKPGRFACNEGNCEGMWSRSSTTRYIACDVNGQLKYQTIINDGELFQDLVGYNSEHFLTGTSQTLRLVEQRSASSGISGSAEPRSPLTLTSLLYTYKINGQTVTVGEKQSQEEIAQKLNQGSQKWAALTKTFPGNMLKTALKEVRSGSESAKKIQSEIVRIIGQMVTEDLFSHESVAEKQITMKILNVARGFSLLSYEEIENVYNQLIRQNSNDDEKKHTTKNVFFDTLLMGGSEANLRFFKTKFEQDEIPTSQVPTLFISLPHYVMTPNQKVLRELFELVKSEKVERNQSLWSHAVMALSKLVDNACLAENKNTAYPANVFGEFCNADSEILVREVIPYLQHQLDQASSQENPARRNVLITSLGLISHENVLPILLPYVEGTAQSSSQVARFLAVYSLSNVGRRNPNLVVPVLFAIFNNRAENTEIRVTAFNTLIKLNPSMAVFQKLAESTWSESDNEILNLVNTAIYSLANQNQQDPMLSTSMNLARKAWLVYPLMKHTAGKFPSTGSLFTGEHLPKLNLGYNAITSWTASNTSSSIPSNLFYKLTYAMDRYVFSPLEIGARFHGFEAIADELIELVSEKENREGKSFAEQIKESMSGEWKEVVEKLRIESRKSQNGAQAMIWMNLFENAPMLKTFEMTSEQIRREITRLMENPSELKQKLEGSNGINYQRFLDLNPSEYMIPSDMGFPIVIEMHQPVALSLKGQMESNLNLAAPSVSAKFQAIYAAQYTGWVGTVCPFNQEMVITGIDEHSVINMPVQIEVQANVQEQKLSIKTTPLASVQNTVDVLHLHVRPFTVAQKNLELEPFTKSGNFKIISSPTPRRTIQHRFGDFIGMDLQSSITTESRFIDLPSVIERFHWFNYNLANVARFSWVSMAMSERQQPSLRMHEFKLRYNPSQSATKEVVFTTSLGCATKNMDSPAKYNTVQVQEQEGERAFLPYKLAAHRLGEKSGHQQRQQKLEQVLREAQIESGNAFVVKTTLSLRGSRSRTFSYVLNAASGFTNGMNAKWAANLESETSSNKICVRGNVQLPSVPTWDIEQLRSALINYRFENTIAYGPQCSQAKMVVNGNAEVSQKQKKFSRISPEAKALKQLIQKDAPLAQLSQVADKVRRQASSLDKINYQVRYENVPTWVVRANNRVITILKGIWWANLQQSSSQVDNVSSQSMTENVSIEIDSQTKSFNLVISRNSGNVVFKHIRIPYPLNYLVPFYATRNPAGKALQVLTGKNLFPVCKFEKNWLQTFDNKTISAQMDECFHLLAADCSQYKRFAVLARSLGQSASANKQVKILIGKTEVKLSPSGSHSEYSNSITLEINGQQLPVGRGQTKAIKNQREQVIGSAQEGKDGVITVSFPGKLSLTFAGNKIQVNVHPSYKGNMCGLCGSNNGQKKGDLAGPQKCIYSKPELVLAAYRVPLASKPCKPLPQHIERQLREQTEQCDKYQEIPTKVIKSFEAQSGKCTRHQHQIIEKANQFCFSTKPVTECGPACKPESGRKVEKTVKFTCMGKEQRMSQHYAQKIRDGMVLPELANQSVDFELAQEQPKSCVPVSRGITGY